MKIVVLKFGGTSVGTIDRIKRVADIVINYTKKKIQGNCCFFSNEWGNQ